MKKSKMTGSKTLVKRCSTCKKPKPANCSAKTCDACRKRSAALRQKKRENKIECEATKQDGTKCTNKVNPKCGNKFCEKHITEWKEYQETGDKEVRRCNSRTQCDPTKPGIKAILPNDYTKKKCESCLLRANKKDTNLRNRKKNATVELHKLGLFVCTECPIDKKYKSEQMGLKKDGSRSHLCKHHFEMQQKIESNRPHRKRDGLRDRYTDLLKTARKKGRPVKVTMDQFYEIAKKDCFYCGLEHPDSLIGLDRSDNDLDYTIDNVVPCCKSCNLSKNTLNKETFILMCTHIATATCYYKTRLFPEIFNKSGRRRYNKYRNDAQCRNLPFELSREYFDGLIKEQCYLCKRCPNENSTNGVDRVDNNLGYTNDNCRPCCGNCNILKKIFPLDDFLIKCALIARRHKNNLDVLLAQWEPSRFIKENKKKLSKEELIEIKKKREEDKMNKKYDMIEV